MAQVLGRADIRVNGKLLQSHPGATLDIGGVTRTSVVGHTWHGFSEAAKQSRLECEITLGQDTRLSDLKDIVDAVITFECDTGQTYVIREAFIVDPPTVTDGSDGRVPLVFEGPPAEEMTV